MDTPQDQTQIIDSFLASKNYADGYRYVASQIADQGGDSANIANWMNHAADINGSAPSFYKDFVFDSNRRAADRLNDAATEAWNQDASDDLASRVLQDYRSSINGGPPLNLDHIAQHDINEATHRLGLQSTDWAGGPDGESMFGFPDTYSDAQAAWSRFQAARTLMDPTLWSRYVVPPTSLPGDVLGFIARVIEAPIDFESAGLSAIGKALKDLLNAFRSDPLILDLDGSGISLTPLAGSATTFDIDSDGAPERTAWISPSNGFLVDDQNGNGLADGPSELIGSGHEDGFTALAALDSNGDGVIDKNDNSYSSLLVWRDLNGDGLSISNEMISLSAAHISSIDVDSQERGISISGNTVSRMGLYTLSDGTRRETASVEFSFSEGLARPEIPDGADTSSLRGIPNIGGSDAVGNLWTAMYFDPTLKDSVVTLLSKSDNFGSFQGFVSGGFLDIVNRWVGLSGDAESSDGYKKQFIENATGASLGDLNEHQFSRIGEIWSDTIEQMGIQFLIGAAQNIIFSGLDAFRTAIGAIDPTASDASAQLHDAGSEFANQAQTAQQQLSFLKAFSYLSINPVDHSIGGDFGAFLKEIISDEPGYFVDTSGFDPERALPAFVPFNDSNPGDEVYLQNPWTKWFHDEGSIVFQVGAAMGIGQDYILDATGWKWIYDSPAEILGTDAADTITAGTSQTTIKTKKTLDDGGSEIDETFAASTDQIIMAGGGDDVVYAGDGDDRIIGGLGNDTLKGGAGSDTYVYNKGDGLDTIIEDSGLDDTIYISDDLSLSDLVVSRPDVPIILN